ncbi:RagB/SusD family nutrient uptake outer membrane protein [Spirosoma arcticum]
MKKIIAIGISVVGLLQSSCREDFLDQTDPTRIGTGVFYKNEAQLKQALNGAYGQLQGIANTAYLFGEFPTDNTTLDFNPLDRGGASGWEAFEFSTVNSGNGEIANLWNQYYSALYNVNFTLQRLPEATVADAPRKEIEGQLKFLRGYLYFNLTQYFGDVVLVTTTLASPNDAFDLVRSPQADVYAQIEKDLKDASTLLPAKYTATADIGRATQGAALSLLGKVYLTKKQYAEATTTLKQVTTLGYTLNANYADNFSTARKNGPESIFEVQYQGDNDLGEWSNFTYVFAPRQSSNAVTGFSTVVPGGRNIPTNDLIAAYEPGDKRKAASLKTEYTLAGKVVPVPYITKFNNPHSIAGRTNDNWPVLRYADVLLMLAEAINEASGPTDEALGYLNQIRTRAGLAALTGLTKDTFRTAVLNERRLELAFENHRWFDLKRTKTPAELAAFMNAYGAKEKANPTVVRGGVAYNALDYVYTDFEYYLPIPAPQILINSKLTQNTGY